MSMVRREGMGNATSLFIFVRNIGGSICIAVVAMMLSRNGQAQYNILGPHVTSLIQKSDYSWIRYAAHSCHGEWTFQSETQAAYVAISGRGLHHAEAKGRRSCRNGT